MSIVPGAAGIPLRPSDCTWPRRPRARLSRLTQAEPACSGLASPDRSRDARPGEWRRGMDLGLTGRTAVVTGGSKGIGLAVVKALADCGARVVTGATRSSPDLTELTRTGRVEVIELDLSRPDGPAQLVAAAGDRVDILVNNV